MTADEYIAKLESRWPKNIPLGLLRDAVIVVSRWKLQEIKAELHGTEQSHNLYAGRLCEYKIGTVDMANFEGLVPGFDAIHFVEVGDYLVHQGKLSQVTRVNRSATGREAFVDIAPVADIVYLG